MKPIILHNTNCLISSKPTLTTTPAKVFGGRLIYSFACILLTLATTLANVPNGADCSTGSVLSSLSSSPSLADHDKNRVFVVKSASLEQDSYRKVKDNFKEVFDKLTINVKENTPIGSKLADIQADNQDPTQNAEIIYAIVGGIDMKSFTLRKDMNKVELINEVNFDYESPKKEFNIIIRAMSMFLRYELDVIISVTDENDNKPQLEDFAIVFNNYKNHFPTHPIGRVPAADADVNDQLRFRVLAGNNAQLVVVNETNGDIQLSPWLNSNVPMKTVIVVAVSDGLNEVVAQLVLTVNLVTETMLQNSIVLRLDGLNRTEFLTRKYDIFLNSMARILGTNNLYGINNIVVFDVEESTLEFQHNEALTYRSYHGSSIINMTKSINVSFSARADGNEVEAYLSSQYIEERIYLNRAHLMQALDVFVAPFQDNLCVKEPCQNYQECQAIYKFEKAPKSFLTTENMIFRQIKASQSFACDCPPTFTGMKHKSECNLQINQCLSNPCLNGGVCHVHESGFSCECKPEFVGTRCEHSFANSTCQSSVQPSLIGNQYRLSAPAINIGGSNGIGIVDDQSTTLHSRQSHSLCSGKSKCVNLNKSHFHMGKPAQLTSPGGGFSCQGCPYPQWSTELCQLKARSFSRNSYITLPSLKRRHRFHIQLQFATVQNDALIFYNGRYNDKHDFIALEIVDSYLRFSYSVGSTVNSVSLSSISVSNGNWHKVAIDYRDRNVTLLVDDCDPIIDEALALHQGSGSKRCSNTSYADNTSNSGYRMLDLSSPMQIGALPSLPTEFQISSVNSFIGCMSDIYIDHQLVDLYSPIQDVGTQIGCPEKRGFCQQKSCNGHPCQDSWGVAKCACGDEYLGKSCEILISNEKVRRFNGNSYLTFNPIDSTVTPTWQVSLNFRSINPNGLLMKISLDPEANILLELSNGGLKLSHRNNNLTFNKITLDDGEWHYVEITWSNEYVQLQIDYNSNLSSQSSDMGSIVNSVIKSVTIGASPTIYSNNNNRSPIVAPSSSAAAAGSPDSPSASVSLAGADSAPTDFSSSVANVPTVEDFSTNYAFGGISNQSSQSFVGCIYGVNISDNAEQWISAGEERNVERGCQIADVCETNLCPANSRCVRKGMNQRKCICNPGFVGERCLPVCDLNPCQGENSKCIPATSSPTTNELSANSNSDSLSLVPSNSYRCECEPNRSGKNCEHQLSLRCPSNWWARHVSGGNSSAVCGPCNCDESKGLDGDCDKITGQCYCKPNYYQPTGSEECLPCDCYSVGSLAFSCNQTTGQCKCRPGVLGRRCDTCASSYAEVTRRGCEVIYDACPKTFSDGVWWDKTPLDKEARQPCPSSTSTGTATRFCHKTEGWQKAKMFDCISNSFNDLFNQYKFLEENKLPMTTSLAMKIATNLRYTLNETITNPATQLYGSDMYISFRLIHHLIQHESQQRGLTLTHKQDSLYIRNIAESINYILDPAYAENWPEIAAREPHVGAEHLLRLIDTYGKVLIESQSDTSTPPFEVSTKYFTFGMDTLSTDQLWDLSRSSSFNSNPPSSPPYATDPFSPSLTSSSINSLEQGVGGGNSNSNSNNNNNGLDQQFNTDGSSIYLDYSSASRDSSPAIIIPKYNNYASDPSNLDITTKALIPLKTLRIKTLQELLPPSYFQARSRAKRDELIIPDSKFIPQQPALVAYSIYRSLGPLLPNVHDTTVQNRFGMVASTNSPVVWLTIRPANGTEFLSKNIQPKINYMLKMVDPSGKSRPQCAVWTFFNQSASFNKNQSSYGIKQTGRFTTKGCQIKGIHPKNRLRFKYDYVNCSCDQLGAITVLMDSANYDYLVSEDTNIKDLAMIVGLGISLIILTAAYFILSCVRGHSIKSNSNSINKSLIFILMLIEILFLYTIISKSSLNQHEYQCKLVAIFLHYFSISLFFWLLVNAIHFYRMLTELRDINHGPMKFYHVLGYAVPAFFVSIAVGLRIEQFGSYLFCWLSVNEPIIWSMFGPICFVSGIIILLFMLALCKSLPVKEDPTGAELLKNHMLINIYKTPLIGVYWIFTVYVFNEALLDYIYLFPAIAILKSLGLLILLCFVDKHIRYNLYVSWLRFRGEKVPFMEETLNYSTNQWMPQMMSGEMPGILNKHHSYAGYNGQLTTPGFQSSCTDIFRPDVLAFSAASTTSRSSATGTSSSAYQYNHRTKDISRDTGGGYGRTGRSKHRRRHKKSHKHHHHRHRHHHHHRSHRHHTPEEYEQYERRRYDAQQSIIENSSQNDLASSHSSDGDDVSTLPKKNFNQGYTNNGPSTSDSQTNIGATQPAVDEQQTVPMELSAPSTSGLQSSPKNSTSEANGPAQSNA